SRPTDVVRPSSATITRSESNGRPSGYGAPRLIRSAKLALGSPVATSFLTGTISSRTGTTRPSSGSRYAMRKLGHQQGSGRLDAAVRELVEALREEVMAE